MAEQIKEFIEKIQQEGVKVAEDKARAIGDEAKQEAQSLIKEAQKEAQSIILDAKDRAAKIEESSLASLRQVSRDMLLALKVEINDMLNRLVTAQVRQALGANELAQILSQLIKDASANKAPDIVVAVKKEDADKLEGGFLGDLKKEVNKGVSLVASNTIGAGFTISYDGGKSLFDFTDKALADYIVTYLKPKLADILIPRQNS